MAAESQNIYEVTYVSTKDRTPISRQVTAKDPFTACMLMGQRSRAHLDRVIRVVERTPATVVYAE